MIPVPSSVIAHLLAHLSVRAEACALPTHFALLQPTSPLRRAGHIREAIHLLESTGAHSVVSAAEAKHPPQKCLLQDDSGVVRPMLTWAMLSAPRQSLPGIYTERRNLHLRGGRVPSHQAPVPAAGSHL